MLRIARLTDRSGRYYLADLSAERDVGPARRGRWTGRGTTALGLVGNAGAEELGAVLSGCHPLNGRPLRRHEAGACGYDLTFAAPKSVSVLFGLGSPDVARVVAAAHDAALLQAMDYVSTRALAARRGSGEERHLVGTDGAIAVSFTHGLSRSLDPHLHTHVVVANVVHGADGRWTAIDGRGLWAHARAAGALYDAHLRNELGAGLGLAWSPRRSGAYELSAISPAVIGVLSGRRAEIRAYLAGRAGPSRSIAGRPEFEGRRSAPSAKARKVAWAVTRVAKPAIVTVEELRQQWTGRAIEAGYEPGSLARATLPDPRALRHRSRLPVLDEHRFAASLVLTAHERPTRRAAVAAWAGAVRTGVAAPTVERCVDRIADWGRAVGVDEGTRPMAKVVASPHLLRAIGPRPSSPEELGVWQQAAAAVDRYRSHWPLEDPRQVLGVDGSPGTLNRMDSRRLAEHVAVTRQVDDARRRLGRALVREPEVPELSLGRG